MRERSALATSTSALACHQDEAHEQYKCVPAKHRPKEALLSNLKLCNRVEVPLGLDLLEII